MGSGLGASDSDDHTGDPRVAPDLTGRHRAVFIISVAAELAGVHPQTLRVYERKGLVAPARTGGMSRRYSEADIARVVRIQELTTEGLNLAGVKRVLAMEQEISALHDELRALRSRQSAVSHDLVPLRQEMLVYRRERDPSSSTG